MKRLFTLLACLPLSFLAACASDDAGESQRDGGQSGAGNGDASDFGPLDQVMEDFVADSGLEGASLILVHKERGVIHHQGYGAFDADRIYAIASSSKVLSAGVLMHLQDEELLDIDAPLGTYLEMPFGEGKPELTAAQLLSNSSGLVSLADNATYAPYICQYLTGSTLTDCAKTIYTADDAEDRTEPDTRFSYGGGQWQLAGGVAEVVSGKTWATLLEDTYGPCGVTTLGYGNPFQEHQTNYPELAGDPDNLTPTDNPNIEGGAYVSISDYGAIMLMHLRGGECEGGRALSEAAVERMREDRLLEVYDGSTGTGVLDGYGLGWWIDRERQGFFSDGGAYGATAWLDLSRDYAGFIALEATSAEGRALFAEVRPVVESILDGE